MESPGNFVAGIAVGAGLTLAVGVALNFERPTDTGSTQIEGTDTEASSTNNTEVLPEVTLPTNQIVTTIVGNTVKYYPLSGLSCDGPATQFSVDSNAYFESTGQYSALKALRNKFGNPAITTVSEPFALNLSRDLAQDNGIDMASFDPNNFPPGTWNIYTSCDTPLYPALIP